MTMFSYFKVSKYQTSFSLYW